MTQHRYDRADQIAEEIEFLALAADGCRLSVLANALRLAILIARSSVVTDAVKPKS